MKIVSFILFLAILNSCVQKQQKENPKDDSSARPALTIDTVEITDSTSYENYSVETDTTYFYASADLNTKMNTYLTKKEWVVIGQKKGEFGYAVRLTDYVEPRGWVKLKDLKQIFFTPPRIAKE